MSVTVQQVDAVVAEVDPVLRNLQITVAYGRLSSDFADRVDRDNVSWCAFGTWASEGVGGAIRHHQTDQSIVLRMLRLVLRGRYQGMADKAADAFAAGNRSVFGHIGRGFAGFHAALDDPSPGAVDEFLAALPSAECPDASVDLRLDPPVGLSDGFRAYHRSSTESDGRRRAQLVALGNLCMAHVEQVRLQRPIVDAFGAVLPGRLARLVPAQYIASRLVTEAVLELRIDEEHFRPGRRLPAMAGRLFPADLEVLDDDLFGPFAAVLAGPDRRRAPDADDWRSLADRLRYIGALMRSRQQARHLIGRLPFSTEQVRQIDAGVVPPELLPPADHG